MIGPVVIKVCGITRAADAALALSFGADHLGVNVWPGSPRCVAKEHRGGLLREIPPGARVAITVNPTAREAVDLLAEGFAVVQAHFEPGAAECDPAALAAALGPDKLWLAPRLADGAAFPDGLAPLARTFVHDAHARGAFGGTGRQADWRRFQALQIQFPRHTWILAGGLGPSNAALAVQAGARFLDLNSGVELSPGLKSAEKMAEVAQALLKTSQSAAP
jgi:phosphoribosylanthranilate isomerase